MSTTTAGKPRRSAGLKRILYVDDDQENREVLRLRLSSLYEIILAANAREACEALLAHDRHLYAILLDIQLQSSDLDGIRLAKLIRGMLPAEEIPEYGRQVRRLTTPILFVAAHGQRYSNGTFAGLGADTLIQKPVDFAQLNIALARHHLKEAGKVP